MGVVNSLKLGFKKLAFGELVALSFIILTNSITGSTYHIPHEVDVTHSSLVNSSLERFASPIIQELTGHISFFALCGLAFFGLAIYGCVLALKRQNSLILLQSSFKTEGLVSNYLNSRLPQLQKLIEADFVKYSNYYIRKAIADDIDHFQSLCALEGLPPLSKEAAIEFCVSVSGSFKSNIKKRLKLGFEERYQSSTIE
ncbi:MAG: hypothetical protein ACFFBD_11560, partial [Candidatus Hodarchaeota archaeon]